MRITIKAWEIDRKLPNCIHMSDEIEVECGGRYPSMKAITLAVDKVVRQVTEKLNICEK